MNAPHQIFNLSPQSQRSSHYIITGMGTVINGLRLYQVGIISRASRNPLTRLEPDLRRFRWIGRSHQQIASQERYKRMLIHAYPPPINTNLRPRPYSKVMLFSPVQQFHQASLKARNVLNAISPTKQLVTCSTFHYST